MMNSVTKFESSWYRFPKSLSQGMSRTFAVGFGTETVIPETDTVVVPAPGFLYSSGSKPARAIMSSMYGTALYTASSPSMNAARDSTASITGNSTSTSPSANSNPQK